MLELFSFLFYTFDLKCGAFLIPIPIKTLSNHVLSQSTDKTFQSHQPNKIKTIYSKLVCCTHDRDASSPNENTTFFAAVFITTTFVPTHSHPLISVLQFRPAVSAANMEPVAGDLCVIETIPFWQSFRIYALSFVFGAWVLFWRLLRCLWDPNGFCRLQARDNPPACLVDTTLGQHKYVKLKVGFSV